MYTIPTVDIQNRPDTHATTLIHLDTLRTWLSIYRIKINKIKVSISPLLKKRFKYPPLYVNKTEILLYQTLDMGSN